MGFYGDITNTARTQFQFDKTYANRLEMETALSAEHSETQTWGTETLKGDGVQIGRYVLVNYSESGKIDEYNTNYNIDKAEYGSQRGYDSTVWQKVYTNGTEAYVMVAELNTITPIFTIAEADAPQIVPIAPHFGDDSSNIFYKLHWSPTWGFRVKAANSALEGPVLETNGSATSTTILMSDDSIDYPSDERTYWHKSDGTIFGVGEGENSGTWVTPSENLNDYLGVPAAIYYNKDGFDPAKVSYGYREIALTSDTYKKNTYYIKKNGVYQLAKTDFDATGETTYYEKIEDHIQIAPTGYSGHKYNSLEFDQDGDGDNELTSVQPDTQELSIMLPAIGDTIAAVWDLIYGGENVNGGTARNLDIKWESAKAVLERKGLRLVTDFQSANHNTENKYDYKVKNVETLAGAINSVHDLMGMIIQTGDHDDLTESMSYLDENRIYYDSTTKTFNRKTKKYRFEPVEETVFEYVEKALSSTTYAPGLYYINDNGEYVIDNSELYDENQTYYVKKLASSQEYTEIDNTQNNYVLFDGTQYAYRDYSEIVYNQLSSPFDFVRDSKYYEDKKYYLWSRVQNAMEGPCQLSDEYEPNRYYIKSGNNYILDFMTTPMPTQHYILKGANLRTLAQLGTYDQLYVPGQYVYANDQGIYIVDESDSMTEGREYYSFTEKTVETEDDNRYILVNHYEPIDHFTESTPYVASKYWYYEEDEDENEENNYHLDENETITPGRKYYKLSRIYKKLTSETTYYERTGTALSLYQFRENCFFTRKSTGFYAISSADVMKDLNKNEIYVLKNTHETSTDGTYVLTENDLSNASVSAILKTDDFYTAGNYYYEAHNHDDQRYSSYILDLNEQKTADRDYYKIDYTKLYEPVVFEGEGAVEYEPGKYYYYALNGSWRLDNFPTPFYPKAQYYQDTSQRLENIFELYKYYEKVGNEYRLITSLKNNEIPSTFYKRDKAYYVLEDLSGVFKKGAVWNRNMAIPPTVTLATRSADEDSYVLEPLPGFARDITTMHGLILKIKALLDNDNETTRDTRTIQGALNVLNDKIAQLDTWQPGQFIIVDDYGRFHGADIKGVQGMTVTVDSNPEQPSIEFGLNLDGTDTDAIDVGEIKLGAYSLNEENTGAIQTGDTLKKALNKLENTTINQQEQFDNLVNWTETITETTPGSKTEIGLARAEFWHLYARLNSYPRYTDGGDKVVRVNSLPGISINNSRSFRNAQTAIAEANNVAGIGMYYYNDNTGKIVPALDYVGSYDYYCLYDYALNYLLQVNDQYSTFYTQGQSYRDPDIINEIEVPHTIENLVEDFPSANFEYEVQPEILLEQNAQNYWDYYLQTVNTFKGDNTLLKSFISLKKVDNVTEDQFTIDEYFYDTLNPTGESSTNTGSYLSFWDRYIADTEYHSEYQYYIYSQATFYWLLSPTDEGFIRVVQKENGQWKNIDSIEDFRVLYSHMDKEIFGYDSSITGAPPFITLGHIYNSLDPNTTVPQINLYTTGIQLLKKHYFNSQHPFEKNIHISTDDYVFKPVNLSTNTYQPNKYYLQGVYGTSTDYNVPFYYLSTSNTFYSNKTYYEVQESPFKEQEREVMNTSLLDICDLLYGVGSLYNTSTNVGVETETDSGIYTLPNMPGEWELIDKRFKYMDIDSNRNNTSDQQLLAADGGRALVWSTANTQDYDLTAEGAVEGQGGPRYLKLIRSDHSIKGSLYWCNKANYADGNLIICSFAFRTLGLDVNKFNYAGTIYGYIDHSYTTAQSDGLDAALLCKFYKRESSNEADIEGYRLGLSFVDTIFKDTQVSTINHPCALSFDLPITQDQMLDEACDQFIWKRIS